MQTRLQNLERVPHRLSQALFTALKTEEIVLGSSRSVFVLGTHYVDEGKQTGIAV